jgi:hypothetical protein
LVSSVNIFILSSTFYTTFVSIKEWQKLHVSLHFEANSLHTPFKYKGNPIGTNDLNFTSSLSPPFHNDVQRVTLKVLLDFCYKLLARASSRGSKGILGITSFDIFRKVTKLFPRIEMKTILTGFQCGPPIFTPSVDLTVVPERDVLFPFVWATLVALGL